jgi:hypothetical protein
MKDVAVLVAKLTPDEINEIVSSGPHGVLSQAALKALDRAGGGSGMGHGYYVSAGTVDEAGTPEFVLHETVAAALFGPNRAS